MEKNLRFISRKAARFSTILETVGFILTIYMGMKTVCREKITSRQWFFLHSTSGEAAIDYQKNTLVETSTTLSYWHYSSPCLTRRNTIFKQDFREGTFGQEMNVRVKASALFWALWVMKVLSKVPIHIKDDEICVYEARKRACRKRLFHFATPINTVSGLCGTVKFAPGRHWIQFWAENAVRSSFFTSISGCI